MPKIPTFTSQARPTAEVGSVKANLQVPLSQTVAGALSPLTDMVVKKSVQANDTQNRTEALRLGNEFIRESNTVEDEVVNDKSFGLNKELGNSHYTEKTNALITKYKGLANNNATKSLFENNALRAVQRGVFRIDGQIERNVLLDLKNQVDVQETSLITQALFGGEKNATDEFGIAGNVNDFDYGTLQTNLTKLYTDAFSGRIPVPKLNAMIGNIPALVQGFQANADIYDNPSFAYEELNKGQNSLVYPDLKVEQRQKLINKVETMMVQPLKKEFANVIFSLQDKGTEQPFNFSFAKKILPIEQYNELQTSYDLAKINAEDVRLIRTLPLSEADALIENKNFGTDLYAGSADRITQAKLQEGLVNARNNRVKQMKEDSVNFITETNPEIAELTNNYRTETNPEVKRANRTILTNALIDEQIRLKVNSANFRILDKQEVTSFKSQFLDPTITSEDKLKLIETLKFTYGNENMGMIVNHLQDEKTPTTILMAISTDSAALAKDLFNSSSLLELKKLATQKEITTESVQKLIAKETEDFGQVIDSQGEGSESKAALMLQINEALLKVALVRMNKNVSAADAVESAANDFLNDYVLNDSLTWLIPKTINKVPVPVVAVQNKAEAIMIGIKDSGEGNYLDTLMGTDGYMHYASSLNTANLTEKQVKERVTFTIRNHSRWLNNSDMTGAVLYADFSNGLQPVVNSAGERVEFYLTAQPNQDPNIKTTESVFPITGDVLPLIPDPNPFGAIEYDVDFENNNIINETTPVSSVISDIFSMGSANASEFVEFENVDVVEIASYEGNKLQGYVPDAKGSKSGVTIASGLDLGARSVNDLKGLPENIITKLKPFLGLKGNEAVARAEELNITDEEAKIINTFAHKQSLTKLKKKWEKDSGQSFDLLSQEQATVLASVAFQYGDLKTKTPKFYKLALAGDWQGVYNVLMDFEDNYPTRREKEAAYLQKYLDNN
jgi:hypothetical protein